MSHLAILGVDPGIRGGLAIVSVDADTIPYLIDAIDIPVTGIGAKERVDVHGRSRVDRASRSSAMRRRSEAEKKLADDARLLRAWRRHRRERLEALLAGPYAEAVRALLSFCKTITTPTALINFITSGPWIDADMDVRAEVLALVDAVIIRRRERMGLVPFDDALPDRPLNVFLILREHLFPPDGGAARGAARFDQQTPSQKDLTYDKRTYAP
jgi:hypothetical protein